MYLRLWPPNAIDFARLFAAKQEEGDKDGYR
jgi:hypothetical protein